MSRAVSITRLAGFVLIAALFGACERSATAPTAPTMAPRLDRGGLDRTTELEAPQHDGGKVSRTLGRSGGRLEFKDPSARGIDYQLDVPRGALAGPTTITMRVHGTRNYRVSLTAEAGGVDVETFKQPIRLTVSYATARHPAPAPHLFVACVHDDGSYELVKTQADAGAKKITGYLPHFSKWTIAVW